MFTSEYTQFKQENQLTARDASSAVEKATNPDPLLIPLGSHITYSTRERERERERLATNRKDDSHHFEQIEFVIKGLSTNLA
jgi:hypothetical protein